MHGLPERGPGVLLIQLGPEEGDHHVAPVKPVRSRECQVRKECQALGLREDGPDVAACRVP